MEFYIHRIAKRMQILDESHTNSRILFYVIPHQKSCSYRVRCLEVRFCEKFSKNSLKNCHCTTKTSVCVLNENSWCREFDVRFADAVWKFVFIRWKVGRTTVCLSKFSFDSPQWALYLIELLAILFKMYSF